MTGELAFDDDGHDKEDGKSGRRKGSSMTRALSLLETIAARGTPATPTQLNEALDLPKPTIHRLCATLEELGFLQKSLDGKGLTVGPRLRAIAQNALLSNEQLFLVRAILEKVSDTVGETANITVPDYNRMRYLDRVETQWPLRLQLPVGSQVPLHCTASGKLYLSGLDPAVRHKILQAIKLEKLTVNTITGADRLEQELVRIEDAGFSTDNEEFIEGMVAVAVPVQGPKGKMIATLAIHGPIVRMSMEQAQSWIPDLRAAAAQLSEIIKVKRTAEAS
jgi:DNA-binding IclR family transcriptional regulator